MEITFDTSMEGLETLMKEYQVLAMKHLWEKGDEGITSAKVWVHINTILLPRKKSISRASVINFLNYMVDQGIIDYTERSGKGGYHRVYTPKYVEAEFKELIATRIIEKLREEFPGETDRAIHNIMNKRIVG